MNQKTMYFVLGDVSSQHVGIALQGAPRFSAPQPRVDVVSVPGRNGDLVFHDGSYENVECEIDCFVLHHQVYDALAAVNGWVNAQRYQKLSFDGDPNAYRLARTVNGAEVAARLRLLNPFTIKLDCKPQRFLVSGDTPVTFAASGVLDNPGVGGLPLIRVYGTSGTVRINDALITINTIDDYIDIDCDLQDAYKGTLNKNSSISCDDFPALAAGRNRVIINGDITRVQITPRWYTL